MSTTSTDPREIEADLERDRADLASTLDALSDRVSVDHLAREALETIKTHAGSYTSSIDSAVRGNPLATALIGAGVAWLLIGSRIGGSGSRDTPAMGHPTHDELPRWESEGGPPPEYGAVAYRPTTSGLDEDDHAWSREAHGLRQRASAALKRIEADARSYAGTARDFATERASVVSGFASDLKARLAHGLDGLSDGSRESVIAARERAYAAALRAERVGRSAVTEPRQMMEDHPIVAGAVAFALGAAVAAALPRTDVEDQAFGAERDRMMDEATRLLRAERGRAMQIASGLGEEIKAAAQDTIEAAKDTLGATAERAKAAAQEAAQRVGDRAAEEFEAVQSSSQSSSQFPSDEPKPVIS